MVIWGSGNCGWRERDIYRLSPSGDVVARHSAELEVRIYAGGWDGNRCICLAANGRRREIIAGSGLAGLAPHGEGWLCVMAQGGG